MAKLTTHILDTANGRPAAGVRVILRRDGEAKAVREAVTSADGRLDAPLMEGAGFSAGQYELSFHVGDYFRAQGAKLADPAFLDVVPVRFIIADSTDYHVPLLISPYGYSTYRGS